MEMTKSVQSWTNPFYLSQFHFAYKRLLLPVFLVALLVTPSTQALTVAALSDSFWAVSCYVALTLVIYHYLALVVKKITP